LILVVTGTHHQPFDRLLHAADLVGAATGEQVVAQVGAATLALPHCEVYTSWPPAELERRMGEARIVVLHGGTSVFLAARALGRRPIVVPRRPEHGEHVDDHQVRFVRSLDNAEAVRAEPETLLDAVVAFTEQRPLAVDPDVSSCAFAERLAALVDSLPRRW
jgi:UDP-N-acetylglucosamine transferase subunit ALG13